MVTVMVFCVCVRSFSLRLYLQTRADTFLFDLCAQSHRIQDIVFTHSGLLRAQYKVICADCAFFFAINIVSPTI